jgi:hypothetical protein
MFRTLEAGVKSCLCWRGALGKSEKGRWEFGMGREQGGVEERIYEKPGTKVDGILSRQGGFPSK